MLSACPSVSLVSPFFLHFSCSCQTFAIQVQDIVLAELGGAFMRDWAGAEAGILLGQAGWVQIGWSLQKCNGDCGMLWLFDSHPGKGCD